MLESNIDEGKLRTELKPDTWQFKGGNYLKEDYLLKRSILLRLIDYY